VATYEYKCEKCGKTFEAEQKMSDPPLENCTKKKCKVFDVIVCAR